MGSPSALEEGGLSPPGQPRGPSMEATWGPALPRAQRPWGLTPPGLLLGASC